MLHALRVGLVIATTASFIANMDVTVANDVGGALDPLHLPIVAPANELWPYPSARAPNLYLGDLRAKIQVSKVGTVTGTLWWRRRDPNFLTKSVAVTDANGTWVENVRVLSIRRRLRHHRVFTYKSRRILRILACSFSEWRWGKLAFSLVQLHRAESDVRANRRQYKPRR